MTQVKCRCDFQPRLVRHLGREQLGSAVQGYREGQRVIAGAITPGGHSAACLCGQHSQDGPGTAQGFKPLGGWRFGNTLDGAQAEYLLVPDAMTNLAPIPDGLTDEQVLMCPDILSTGFAGAESGGVRIGDTVAVFAQGPIGLCATAGAPDGRDHDHRRRRGARAHGDRPAHGGRPRPAQSGYETQRVGRGFSTLSMTCAGRVTVITRP